MTSDTLKITISKEFEQFIIPLSKEEYRQLEVNIKEQGCRDPLVVWRHKGENILLDGHNRYSICEHNGLSYRVAVQEFKSLEEAKLWMVNNQLGRRNLTPDQMSYYRGLRYESLKRQRGGYENVASKGRKVLSTAQRLGNEFNVSEKTIKRDAKFARGLELIGRSNARLKVKILSGKVKVKKSDIQALADCDDPEFSIKNEADLYNKAQAIKDRALDDLEKRVEELEMARLSRAQEVINSKEPMFLGQEDRITRLKGQIISAINRAIRERDSEAVDGLRLLIDKLANEILD